MESVLQFVLSDSRSAVNRYRRKILIQNLDPVTPSGRKLELRVERLEVPSQPDSFSSREAEANQMLIASGFVRFNLLLQSVDISIPHLPPRGVVCTCAERETTLHCQSAASSTLSLRQATRSVSRRLFHHPHSS